MVEFRLPGLPDPPRLPDLPGFGDHGHGNHERHGHHEREFNPMEQIAQSLYQPGSSINLFDRGRHSPNVRNLPILEIVDQIQDRIESQMQRHGGGDNYGEQGQARPRNPYEQLAQPSTSRELMDTLDRHSPNIKDNPNDPYVSKGELRDYLRYNRDRLDPRERKNLIEVLSNFDRIASSDRAGDTRNGISGRDMNAYVDQNVGRDESIEIRRERNDRRDSARRDQGYDQPGHSLYPARPGDDRRYAPSDNTGNRPGEPRINYPNDRVITQPEAAHNGHYFVDGPNMGLSQEEFKRFYNIPQEVDLLKFMNGKANDGKVVDFFQSGVAGGLGGPKDESDPSKGLKWNDPNYHTLKYDFSRNLQQVWKYTDGMSEQQAKQFAFNFARTQIPVFQSNGYQLNKVENETVTSTGEGRTGTTDFVEDIGGKMKIQW